MNGPTNGTTAAMEIASHDFSIFANSIASFQRPRGKFPEERAHDFFDWQSNRRRQGIWFYSRSLNREPGPATDILADSGRRFSGINFACQDYLGLAGHPRVIEAATDALCSFGPHSAGVRPSPPIHCFRFRDETKRRPLLCHKSQYQPNALQPGATCGMILSR